MIPEDRRYHKEHEWIRIENNSAVLGITDFAQDSMGDIVYVDLPKPGDVFQSGQEIGEVESTKTTSPIYIPLGGTILSVNEELKEHPELINKDPYHRGWIVTITPEDKDQVRQLMTGKEYGDYIAKEGH